MLSDYEQESDHDDVMGRRFESQRFAGHAVSGPGGGVHDGRLGVRLKPA
jgi:hypothetical protein